MAGGATPARAPRRARRDPDIHSEALGAGFVPIWWRSCVVPVALLLGVVSSQRHLERLQRASRASPVGLGEGFASPGLAPKKLQGRSGIGFCLGGTPVIILVLSPPAKLPTARPRARALRLRAAACRPSGLGRRSGPVAMSNALHGRWASRRSLVFPSRLVQLCHGWRRSSRHMCSLGSSCAPLAEGLHHTRWPSTTAPHRPAPPGRRVAFPTHRRR